MQKENQKLREAGRKEYNESVRQLAQFIQRRDERYTRLQEGIYYTITIKHDYM
jgi:DnaJ family protein A protein 5